jgi:hypothetical protein
MMMLGSFRNVILCEDVREEAGNKKSLMGVFGGDLQVQEFPAAIRIAFYVEYIPPQEGSAHALQFVLLVDENIAATGTLEIPAGNNVAALVIPQGIAQFAKEGDLALQFGVGDDLVEILRKKVMLGIRGTIASPTAAPPPS